MSNEQQPKTPGMQPTPQEPPLQPAPPQTAAPQTAAPQTAAPQMPPRVGNQGVTPPVIPPAAMHSVTPPPGQAVDRSVQPPYIQPGAFPPVNYGASYMPKQRQPLPPPPIQETPFLQRLYGQHKPTLCRLLRLFSTVLLCLCPIFAAWGLIVFLVLAVMNAGTGSLFIIFNEHFVGGIIRAALCGFGSAVLAVCKYLVDKK